jgi:Flp pilus assembly protein TadG
MKGKKAMSVFRRAFYRGQSMVEFAMISALVFAVMLLGIQYALIGQAAVALSQGTSALARYVANNPGALGPNNGSGIKGGSLKAAQQEVLKEMLPSSIQTNGLNDVTITITSNTASGATEKGNIVPQSDQLIITLQYDATSKLVLPNPFMAIPPIFSGITFPTAVSASDSQMYEN